MATRLTKSEIQLLEGLRAAGEHGRRIAGALSEEIAHLMSAHCIKRLPGVKLHSITERGRQALAEAGAGKK